MSGRCGDGTELWEVAYRDVGKRGSYHVLDYRSSLYRAKLIVEKHAGILLLAQEGQ